MAKHLNEPRVKVFWDTSIWLCLLSLGNEPQSPRQVANRESIRLHFPEIEMGSVGLVTSLCLLADAPKDVRLNDLLSRFQEFEAAGYATIVEPTADWAGIAALREAIRRDVAGDPVAFSSLAPDRRRQSVGLGDTAVIYAALKTGCDDLWTFDPLMLLLSGRKSVRNLRISEPHSIQPQASLFDYEA